VTRGHGLQRLKQFPTQQHTPRPRRARARHSARLAHTAQQVMPGEARGAHGPASPGARPGGLQARADVRTSLSAWPSRDWPSHPPASRLARAATAPLGHGPPALHQAAATGTGVPGAAMASRPPRSARPRGTAPPASAPDLRTLDQQTGRALPRHRPVGMLRAAPPRAAGTPGVEGVRRGLVGQKGQFPGVGGEQVVGGACPFILAGT
jgi:hypothetical protein